MTDTTTIKVYTSKAQDYADLGISPEQQEALKDFLAAMPAGATLLDIGCGPGLHAEAMQRAGHTVVALDATPAFVNAACTRGVDARLGTYDDIEDVAAYDGIWSSFSLLHTPRRDLPRHIGSMARALKPGGVLFIGMKIGTGETRDRLGRAYTYVTEAELCGLVTDAALTVASRVTGSGTGLDGSEAPYILLTATADA